MLNGWTLPARDGDSLAQDYMRLLQTSGIYAIFNTVNGRVYIGQACRFHDRWRAHRNLLNLGTHHNSALQWDWIFYSDSVFQFSVLEEMSQREFWRNGKYREYFYMAKYLDRLYNVSMPANILVYTPDSD